MTKYALLLWAIGAAAGFAAGLAHVDRARATTDYTLDVMGGATAYMTCGWHGSCEQGEETSGVALDWRSFAYYDEEDHSFYFRVFMWKDSGSTSTEAQGEVEVPTGETCKTVWIHITSPYPGQPGAIYRGTVIYKHVSSSAGGNTININASTSGYWTESQVGETVTSENSGCPWESEHLHQRAYWENATGSRNTSVYPNYVNAGWYAVDDSAYHQDKGQWSY